MWTPPQLVSLLEVRVVQILLHGESGLYYRDGVWQWGGSNMGWIPCYGNGEWQWGGSVVRWIPFYGDGEWQWRGSIVRWIPCYGDREWQWGSLWDGFLSMETASGSEEGVLWDGFFASAEERESERGRNKNKWHIFPVICIFDNKFIMLPLFIVCWFVIIVGSSVQLYISHCCCKHNVHIFCILFM